jgi:hypothetical protein
VRSIRELTTARVKHLVFYGYVGSATKERRDERQQQKRSHGVPVMTQALFSPMQKQAQSRRMAVRM